MMQGNKLQSTGYQPVRQYIFLQTANCKVPQHRVGQYHCRQLSKVNDINHIKTYLLYTHTSHWRWYRYMTLITYLHIYKSWDAPHITGHHTHTHSDRNAVNLYVPHTGFHSHYDSTVLRQITHDTPKVYGHKSTVHPRKNLLYMKTKRHYFPTESRVRQNWMEVNSLPHAPATLYPEKEPFVPTE